MPANLLQHSINVPGFHNGTAYVALVSYNHSVIYLLHGDSYRVRAALREIRDKLDDPDQMLESNTTLLDGRAVTPDELMAHAMSRLGRRWGEPS